MSTLKLYFTTLSPPARSVLMALKHLNIDHQIVEINLRSGQHLKPEYAKVNPARQVPAIDDNGFILWESRAILQYLCNQYAPNSHLYPSEPKKRAVVDKMLSFSFSYHQSIREALSLKVVRGIDPTEAQINNYKNQMKLLDTLIGDQEFVCGNEVTIADISLAASSTALSINDFQDVKSLPKLKAWYERLKNGLPYWDEVNGHIPGQYKQLVESKQTFYNPN